MNHIGIILISLSVFFSCSSNHDELKKESTATSLITDTVVFAMWQNDAFINQYVETFVRVNLLKNQQTFLKTIDVNKVYDNDTCWDMAWVNGANLLKLKNENKLYSKLNFQLPHFKWVDMENPFIYKDHQRTIDQDQCPWGQAQFLHIYNANYITDPPKNLADLSAFLSHNKGRFTFSRDFSGQAWIKSLMIERCKGLGKDYKTLSREEVESIAELVFDDLRALKPLLWKEGNEIPEDVNIIHQLYAKGEVWFTYSYNTYELYNKNSLGIFPSKSKVFHLGNVSLRNAHYLVVNNKAQNKMSAIKVVNYLISEEAQIEKAKIDVWGDGSVLKKNYQENIKAVNKRNQRNHDWFINPQQLNEIAVEEAPVFWEEIIKEKLKRF